MKRFIEMCLKTLNTINDCCTCVIVVKEMISQDYLYCGGERSICLGEQFQRQQFKQTREIELDLIPVGDLYSRLPFTLLQPS